ncbi:unnamed protein product [Closterium sp. NIES-64]|nr:unnamed protein product [Closterium sp. NIES-64]
MPRYLVAIATLRVLSFDTEGRPIQFETWLDDLHSKDNDSHFDHTSGASVAPTATTELSARSQWQTRDAAARLAVRNHLPLAKLTHFGEHKTAKVLNDTVVARCSSPATAELSRLMLPYLFPELSTFATVADLISHLRTSDSRLRAALPKEFCAKNPPLMHWTLHFIVTRLSDSLRSGCSPSPLDPSYATAAAVDLLGAESVGAASSPSGRHCNGKGKGAKGSGGGIRGGGVVVEAVEEEEVAEGVLAGVQTGVVALVAAVELVAAEEVAAAVAAAVAAGAAVAVEVAVGVEALELASESSSSSVPRHPSSSVSGLLSVGGLGVVVAARMAGVDIFALDYDAIIAAMYALEVSADGDCYFCVPPDPGIEAAALGASESSALGAGESALSGNVPPEALHTFTLDSSASRCFFRDSTALTPLPAPVAVSLADPSGGPVLARSTTVLPCPAVLSSSLSGLHLPSFSTNLVSIVVLQDARVDTFTPGWQRVAICTCSQTGRHLATFTRRPGSSLFTLTTVPPQVAATGQVSASGQVASPCECRSLSHQTLLWHHRLGHPSLPRLRGMHRRLLVSGLPRSLPPLPASPVPPCLPCVEGRQRAAPHSSSFPLTEAPLQTLHMDVWGPARVRGLGGDRYFLLVVDDYSRYTTVFPLRTKDEVPAVLIPWIRTLRLQLHRRFLQDLPVLRLHSDRGGEFSSDLLRAFCQGEGILQSFTLPGSPQQNGVAERRIGLVMEIARTSLIHGAAPHFLWSFEVRYAAQQLNLWPRVSLPETSPTLRWTGEVGDASVFRVWGARALLCDSSADKLSSRTVPCVFLGFVPDAPGWQFYHPTSCRVFPS